MQDTEKQQFFGLMADVYAFYHRDTSRFALNVWWEAMKPFDYPAVSEAINRHCVNPDNGQYVPKPSDIVKLLRGSTQDGALVAWAKVDKAVRTIGTYRSVTFDDPIILLVLQDMGGWIALGTKKEDEWPFVAREFENRYRGYATRPSLEYPRWLPGISEAQNSQAGQPVEPPVLIGDAVRAKAVLQNGSDTQRIGFQQLSEREMQEALAPSSPQRLQA